jgi:hypothetical protein
MVLTAGVPDWLRFAATQTWACPSSEWNRGPPTGQPAGSRDIHTRWLAARRAFRT